MKYAIYVAAAVFVLVWAILGGLSVLLSGDPNDVYHQLRAAANSPVGTRLQVDGFQHEPTIVQYSRPFTGLIAFVCKNEPCNTIGETDERVIVRNDHRYPAVEIDGQGLRCTVPAALGDLAVLSVDDRHSVLAVPSHVSVPPGQPSWAAINFIYMGQPWSCTIKVG